ncbi:ATP synthase F1 subunit epsilon [Vaginisenegalia massiliensis]|uniref:ATP synthase F1 subunit epsilon n=1 Tax=Vaginisenegalia massiliensis TaxID=2058294 RepID=UPI000F54330B|nr:ATP synthase F1 subunit epsilon [Vaginisenegalia massiliensis]
MAEQEKNKMQVNIYSPRGQVYSHHAYACSVHSVDGGLTILPNHAPILVALDISAVKVRRATDDDREDYIAVNGGVLEMRNNICEITSNSAFRARDIDEAQARVDKAQAEADLATALSNNDTQAFKRAKIALARAVNMISVSSHRRN